ncbi:hypothetical protein [Amphiplicatus metriothermophilus]|uniref:hypothetical protein n=1 Tax=Amphiplicatus metriothermophilus TaxID=1519374 RepID=UPI001177C233|nr:hypothetical protein [Amphiplicatus metriothermophilus]MBB5518126.1 hypothetical protein [Amphiplicatus metriothermophilus]
MFLNGTRIAAPGASSERRYVFSEFEISGNQLIAKQTGAQIPLTVDSFRDGWRIASFAGIVQAVRTIRLARGREPRARISFFPQKPRFYYAIWPVCQLADVKIVDDPAEADLHFYFEDREFLTAPPAAPSDRPAFNVGCYDIRKSVVARVFEETFGYGLTLDPTAHDGPAVEKSEGNGRHDGRIVACPLPAPTPGRVYQRLIDNTFDGVEFVDIRTPIVGGRIPFVYLKRRTRARRFSNDNRRVDVVSADAMLSSAEQARIAAFARAMALDFGGLDVLRDRGDGRIYIVDANKTDMGPPSALSGKGKLKAMRGLADAFAAMVEARLDGRP